MGCMKSKETFPFPTTLNVDIDKLHESEEAFMPDNSCQYRTPPDEQQQVQEVKKSSEPSAVIGSVILEFADRLANEIVEEALQQWAANIQYYNIPYIESEGSDTTVD